MICVKDLSDIEIRIGGVVYVTACDMALNATIKVGTAPGKKSTAMITAETSPVCLLLGEETMHGNQQQMAGR